METQLSSSYSDSSYSNNNELYYSDKEIHRKFNRPQLKVGRDLAGVDADDYAIFLETLNKQTETPKNV